MFRVLFLFILLLENIFSEDITNTLPLVARLRQPKVKTTLFIRALDEFSRRNYLQAYKLFINSNVPRKIKLFNAGLSLERAGRYAEAFKLYKRLGTVDSFYRASVCCTVLNRWICVVKYLELWHQNRKSQFFDFEYLVRLGGAYLALNSLDNANKYLDSAVKLFQNKLQDLRKDATNKHIREGRVEQLGIRALKDYARLSTSLADRVKLHNKTIDEDLNLKFAYYLRAENAYLSVASLGDVFYATSGLYELASFYLELYNKFVATDKVLAKVLSSLLKKSELTLIKNISLAKKFNIRNIWIINSELLLKKVKKLTATGGEW